MSASLLVDLGNTCQLGFSFPPDPTLAHTAGASGGQVDSRTSGVTIGAAIDMLHANTFCNVVVNGICFTSGPLVVQVQTALKDTSGTYSDPTSGFSFFPTSFQSGGQIYVGLSGDGGGLLNSGFVSGQSILSGFAISAGFQRPAGHRYARINVLSGFFVGQVQAMFVTNLRTTGIGGGQSQQPGSGSPTV